MLAEVPADVPAPAVRSGLVVGRVGPTDACGSRGVRASFRRPPRGRRALPSERGACARVVGPGGPDARSVAMRRNGCPFGGGAHVGVSV
ncbi:hypothetical protein [Embleya sp. NPDC005575]|uniref:hypothetical protein n=1 Tax=Embleya sp. NPDC005575 TaxID=3156892 RepID=UPI0033AD286B